MEEQDAEAEPEPDAEADLDVMDVVKVEVESDIVEDTETHFSPHRTRRTLVDRYQPPPTQTYEPHQPHPYRREFSAFVSPASFEPPSLGLSTYPSQFSQSYQPPKLSYSPDPDYQVAHLFEPQSLPSASQHPYADGLHVTTLGLRIPRTSMTSPPYHRSAPATSSSCQPFGTGLNTTQLLSAGRSYSSPISGFSTSFEHAKYPTKSPPVRRLSDNISSVRDRIDGDTDFDRLDLPPLLHIPHHRDTVRGGVFSLSPERDVPKLELPDVNAPPKSEHIAHIKQEAKPSSAQPYHQTMEFPSARSDIDARLGRLFERHSEAHTPRHVAS